MSSWRVVSTMPYQKQAQQCARTIDGEVVLFSTSFFADGVLNVVAESTIDVRNASVLVLILFEYHEAQSIHDQLMSWFFIIDQIRRMGAREIVACIPYLSYSRHDKSEFDDRAGFLDTVMRLYAQVGVTRVITCELHNEEVADRCAVPLTSFSLAPLWARHIGEDSQLENYLLLSPDKGGLERVRRIADMLGVVHGYVDKKRFAPNQTKVLDMHADVEGKNVIIVDDILDTAGTAVNCVQVVREHGARNVYGCFTHGIFSPPASERIAKSAFDTIWVSDTIPSARRVNLKQVKHVQALPWFFEQVTARLTKG